MADPTPEEVAHAIEVLKALEVAHEKAAETEHVTEQATASHVPVESAPVAPAAPTESTPAQAEAPAAAAVSEAASAPASTLTVTTYIPALALVRFDQFSSVRATYLAWHPANGVTQHEADAEFRAFDQQQLDALNRALHPAT